MPGFDELGLSPALLRGVREIGFEEPTPVQAQSIPLLLEGKDVVAQALTGTGKTAAYGLPLVDRIDPKLYRPQAIVLAPTRELAVQIAEHLAQLGRHLNLRLLPIYGGQPIDRQFRALSRGVHAIVATPGRLMDHMRRGTVDLSEVRLLVLDEADQMLQMGFQEDVEYVMGHLQPERVTALFSATMPKPILDIVKRYMREPEMIILSKPNALTVPEVDQTYFEVPFPRKFDALCRVMDARQTDHTIVFCSTKRMVDEIVERLPARGYAAEGLHGDISQSGRERVLRSFREGRTEVLVATDVAARGLDIPEVSLVINFDIPPDPEYYVHRIGRTARSGRTGEAITFINPREYRELQIIERVTGARIRRGVMPTPEEAEEREAEQLRERLVETIERGHWRRFRKIVEGLAIDYDPADIAAAALQMGSERRITRRTGQHRSQEEPVERMEFDRDRGSADRPRSDRPLDADAPAGDRPRPEGERRWGPPGGRSGGGKPSFRPAASSRPGPDRKPHRNKGVKPAPKSAPRRRSY